LKWCKSGSTNKTQLQKALNNAKVLAKATPEPKKFSFSGFMQKQGQKLTTVGRQSPW